MNAEMQPHLSHKHSLKALMAESQEESSDGPGMVY